MCGSFGRFISFLALQSILPNYFSYNEAYHAKRSLRTRPRLFHSYRRQRVYQIPEEELPEFADPTVRDDRHPDPAYIEGDNFTTQPPETLNKTRTTPTGATHEVACDHIATACLHAYRTGKLCGRTIYYKYETFENYCMLDYVNCVEGEEAWQAVHMGECYSSTRIDEFINYPYHDDFFLDQYYVVDGH